MIARVQTLLFLFISLHVLAQPHQKLHRQATVIDTHNDVLIAVMQGHLLDSDLRGKTHSDLARFREGGVDVQVFSVWSSEKYGQGKGFAYAKRQIDSLYAIAARNKDKMMVVTNPRELKQAVKKGKLGAMIGVEGGHMIEDNLQYLDSLHARGTRYLTLTWNNSTSWASSAADEEAGTVPNAKKGLNDLGKTIVQRMNTLGMMVDLSHVGEQTFWDVMEVTKKPVLVSHSCAYALCAHPRNLTDSQIKAVGKNGGVIHLNFYAGFLDPGYSGRRAAFQSAHKNEIDSLKAAKWSNDDIELYLHKKYPQQADALKPPLSLLIDHLDHIVSLIGVDGVGLGSDYDGIEAAPKELDDVTTFPLVTKALMERGYSKKDIKKILGGNFIRVFTANSH
ncbi:MAG: dipeptidase [Chitinophagaceae bacterium]